jgi:putative PIG3 family NAD(P)H quinone oxidoreductase
MMRAITIRGGKGGADALVVERVPTPEPGPGQVLIRVRAAGVNRPDILQREGHYPPPPGASPVLGLEVAGDVTALGSGVTRWKVGDAVTALLGGGGYAEFALVDERHALPVPRGLSMVEAAALPETVFTVWTNVFERGRLASGETLLVHGGNSGIGVTAIQMAKAAGARVIATARGAAKAERARGIGADLALDASTGDWAEAVQSAGGADVILDMVAGSYIPRNIECLAREGRLVIIALLGGTKAEVDFRPVLQRWLTVTGSTLRPRSLEEKGRIARALEKEVWPLLESGEVAPVIHATFPLAEAAAAHRLLESGTHVGKVVLVA